MDADWTDISDWDGKEFGRRLDGWRFWKNNSEEIPDFKLPFLMADSDSVTISGHSAGCAMADQMMIIHSSTIKGAGLY